MWTWVFPEAMSLPEPPSPLGGIITEGELDHSCRGRLDGRGFKSIDLEK